MYRNINREKRNSICREKTFRGEVVEKFIEKKNENVCGLSTKKSTTHRMRMGIGRKKKIGLLYGEVTILTILTTKNIFTIYKLYKSYVLTRKI